MKNILTGLIILFAISANAQSFNKKMEDPNRHKEVMINKCSREAITSFAEFKESYDPNYNSYVPDSTALDMLSKSLINSDTVYSESDGPLSSIVP